ncbi:hypothetical protein DFH08DRAFT_969494 [Mycena albidolilacea]|uniref:Galactose oxidase n=1 Tax=Mycena albidolilacea TaxID=1033008 RepID=A0AAD7EGY4_9AGAR|nr:hypothetical protein DFH08DRAFT_969494 [Mycena albidolilacea]
MAGPETDYAKVHHGGHMGKISVSPLARSSHSIDVVAGTVYIFGGELEPRKPVDDAIHAVTLPSTASPADYYVIEAKGETGVPSPRVGHATAAIGHRIFMFGGRGGPEMEAMDERGRVWVFDTRTQLWSYLDPNTPAGASEVQSTLPPPRSYHSAVATDANGADAPGKPRGGTTLAISGRPNRLYRFGGFNGAGQEGGQLDYLELGIDRAEWQSLMQDENNSTEKSTADKWPGHRSVAGMESIAANGRKEYLVLMFGEREPSNAGHAAAGKFWNESGPFRFRRANGPRST